MAALNEVQSRFHNAANRRIAEDILWFIQRCRNFSEDFANQQDPLPTAPNNEVLDDGRTDAPQWTAQRSNQIKALVDTIIAQLDGPTENVLIQLSVRELDTIRRGTANEV